MGKRGELLGRFSACVGLLSCGAWRLEARSKQKLEVEKHLNRFNKAPVKSIQVVLHLPFQYVSAIFASWACWSGL